MRAVTFLSLGVSLLSVNSLNISTSCEVTLGNIVASPDAACLNPSALVSLALGSPNSSVIGPINTWLTGLCALPACSNATVAAVVNNITQGCSAELSDAGLTTSASSTADLVTTVQEIYPTVREVFCLSESAGELCVTELLTDIQTIIGNITIDSASTLIANLSSLDSIPSNITCSDCIKEAYNIVNAAFPPTAAALQDPLQSQCGSSFTNGSKPSDVVEIATASASAAASSSVSSSASIPITYGTAVGPLASILLVVCSASVFML